VANAEPGKVPVARCTVERLMARLGLRGAVRGRLMVEEANLMTNYARMYRLGIAPWERYGSAAAATIARLLDREEIERLSRLGRALDLGCGRGQYTPELQRRGWQAVGIDNVPAAIEEARRKSPRSVT
jgi:SAM-dependent methyltransferase